MGVAVGFRCPECGHDTADVIWLEPPKVRLRCAKCEACWTDGD